MEIRDQVFAVIGDAPGLGVGIVHTLAEAGSKVMIADLNETAGTALVQELGGRFVRCNVTSEVDGQAAVEAATSLGILHELVSCAGVTTVSRTVGKTGPHSLDQFARVINTNLIGTLNTIRLAATAIASNAPDTGGERGAIISTASVAALSGQIGQAAYTTSRGGMVAMTLAIVHNLPCDGIRVMTVAPGILETPVLLGMPVEMQDVLGKVMPLPLHPGKPPEYVQLACAIVENPMPNGETICLDDVIRIQPGQTW